VTVAAPNGAYADSRCALILAWIQAQLVLVYFTGAIFSIKNFHRRNHHSDFKFHPSGTRCYEEQSGVVVG
jgi:hypothetical protein